METPAHRCGSYPSLRGFILTVDQSYLPAGMQKRSVDPGQLSCLRKVNHSNIYSTVLLAVLNMAKTSRLGFPSMLLLISTLTSHRLDPPGVWEDLLL